MSWWRSRLQLLCAPHCAGHDLIFFVSYLLFIYYCSNYYVADRYRVFFLVAHSCVFFVTLPLVLCFWCALLCVSSLWHVLCCKFTMVSQLLCLGSGQGGGCRFVEYLHVLAFTPLRGIAAFCRYSRVGNLDVRGALIFECSSHVEGSRCTTVGLLVQGGSHLVSGSESIIIKLYQAL